MKEYETIESLAKELGVCRRTVQNRVREMSPHIGKEYPEEAMLKDGRTKRIRVADYFHFCNHREEMMA